MRMPAVNTARNHAMNWSGRLNRSLPVRRIRALGICALFLVLAMSLGGRANAQAAAPAGPRSKVQAERRQEIRQKKIDDPESNDGTSLYRHSPMVQKLAGMFGLQVETAARLFEVLNFLILMAGVIWLIARLLPKAMRARTEAIRSEIEQARIATGEATRRLAAVEERLARLDAEIDAIRTQAIEETALEETRLRAAFDREKQLILEAAAQDIAAASSNAQSRLKRLAAELVIEQAKRQIALSPGTDQLLIEGFLADLKKTHSRGVN